jgi:hypothetical protein
MVEIKQVIGKYRKPDGTTGRIAWDHDQVFLDGRFMATINRHPGNPFWVRELLSESQVAEISKAVAEARGGVAPAWIKSHLQGNGVILDDEVESSEGDDTETDELSDE